MNKCVRWTLEHFTFLIRLAFLAALFYFVLWKAFLCDMCYKSYHALSGDWWRSKTDPWITNASCFNTLLNWPILIICLVILAAFSVFVFVFTLLVSCPIFLFSKYSPKDKKKYLGETVLITLWAFFRGLNKE